MRRIVRSPAPRALAALFISAAMLLPAAAFAESATAEAQDDPVLAALKEVAGNRADLFMGRSSVLGELPGPAELAGAQPNFRQRFTCKPPYMVAFTAEQARDLARKYKCYTFTGPARSAGLTSLGISGAYIRDDDTRPDLAVIAVVPGTPAGGKLRVDDIIIGANGDPRRR